MCVITFCSVFRNSKVWSNMYFVDLLEYDWVQIESPAGNPQWTPTLKADATDSDIPEIIMLTSDVALLFVSESISRRFCSPNLLTTCCV